MPRVKAQPSATTSAGRCAFPRPSCKTCISSSRKLVERACTRAQRASVLPLVSTSRVARSCCCRPRGDASRLPHPNHTRRNRERALNGVGILTIDCYYSSAGPSIRRLGRSLISSCRARMAQQNDGHCSTEYYVFHVPPRTRHGPWAYSAQPSPRSTDTGTHAPHAQSLVLTGLIDSSTRYDAVS